MKKSKKIIVIILSILIVLLSLVSFASSILRLGVLNPVVYSKLMPALNSYDSLYESFTNYLLEPIKSMDVPEEVQGVPEDIVQTAISEEDFNKRIGETIGGGIGWLFYNHEDVEIPVKYFAESLNTAIAEDERVINSTTNIKATMEAIVAQRLAIFAPGDDYEQNFRGYVYYYLTSGNQDYMSIYDYWTDVFFYYYGIRLSIITAVSFALLLALIIVLVLITKENRKAPIKLVKVLCLFYGTLNTIIALVLFAVPWAAKSVQALSSYAKYIEYAKGVINSFGFLALGYGLLLIVIAIILGVVQGNIAKEEQ